MKFIKKQTRCEYRTFPCSVKDYEKDDNITQLFIVSPFKRRKKNRNKIFTEYLKNKKSF